jgi:hypothetical protein
MLQKPYIYMIPLMLYRATPHRRGEGVPVTLLNTTEWQRYASQQLRRRSNVSGMQTR